MLWKIKTERKEPTFFTTYKVRQGKKGPKLFPNSFEVLRQITYEGAVVMGKYG